jgi:glycerophosphoryl diester phosphodiesterase
VLTRVFAHRGSAHEAPENSLAAFVEARRLGADGVELDVRRSADGALVVHHDPVIDGVGPIAQLRVVDIPDRVPLLAGALDACTDLMVNVEVKIDHADDVELVAAEVAAQLAECRPPEAVTVSSFDLGVLEAIRRADGDLAVGWLIGFGADAPAALEVVIERRLDALHPFVLSIDEPLVAAARAGGVGLVAWTVNARHDLVAMGRFGLDAVITDDVALAREVLVGLDARSE